MINIATLTTNKVKNLKPSELDLMLLHIPAEYKKAIVKLIKELAVEPENNKKYESLGQMISQVVWINAQQQIQERMNETVFLEDV